MSSIESKTIDEQLHHHMIEEADDNLSREEDFRITGNSFTKKLMVMTDDPTNDHIIQWTEGKFFLFLY
jgi:hypothetical protein